MRSLALVFAATLGLGLGLGFGGAALADPVEGLWQTEPDAGLFAFVRFAPCGERLCGTVARTFRAAGEYRSDRIGQPIVWDMAPAGNGAYAGGKILQPSTGKVYRSKMTLEGDVLKVAGCVGPICKKQAWVRVK